MKALEENASLNISISKVKESTDPELKKYHASTKSVGIGKGDQDKNKISKIKVTSSHARIQTISKKSENRLLQSDSSIIDKNKVASPKTINEEEVLNPFSKNYILESKKDSQSFNNDYLQMKINQMNIKESNIVSKLLNDENNLFIDLIGKKLIKINKETLNINAILEKLSDKKNTNFDHSRKIKELQKLIQDIEYKIKKQEEKMFIIENTDFSVFFNPDIYSQVTESKISSSIEKQPFFKSLKNQQKSNIENICLLKEKLDFIKKQKSFLEANKENKFDKNIFIKNFTEDTEKVKCKLQNVIKQNKELEDKRNAANEKLSNIVESTKNDYVNSEKSPKTSKDKFTINRKKNNNHSTKANSNIKLKPFKEYTYIKMKEKYEKLFNDEINNKNLNLIKVKLERKQKLKRISLEDISHFQQLVDSNLTHLNQLKLSEKEKLNENNKRELFSLFDKINNYHIKGTFRKKALESDAENITQILKDNKNLQRNKEKLNSFLSNIKLPKISKKAQHEPIYEKDSSNNTKTQSFSKDITFNKLTKSTINITNISSKLQPIHESEKRNSNQMSIRKLSTKKCFKFKFDHIEKELNKEKTILSDNSFSNESITEMSKDWEKQQISCNKLIDSVKDKISILKNKE